MPRRALPAIHVKTVSVTRLIARSNVIDKNKNTHTYFQSARWRFRLSFYRDTARNETDFSLRIVALYCRRRRRHFCVSQARTSQQSIKYDDCDGVCSDIIEVYLELVV